MDLALRWLLFFAFFMWILLCLLHNQSHMYELAPKAACFPVVPDSRNNSPSIEMKETPVKQNLKIRMKDDPNKIMSYIHYFMFFAGAMVVTIYNRRKEIINFTQYQFVKIKSKIKLRESSEKVFVKVRYIGSTLKVMAVRSNTDVVRKLEKIWQNRRLFNKIQISQLFSMLCYKKCVSEKRVETLLKKLKEVYQERNQISLLLIAALQENKNTKQQWQVDHLAKIRLLQEIQSTQKQIKELRAKYVNFQRLYLVTHQENIFLKNYIKKINKDKAESDQTLMLLVSKVYQSVDNNLKAYCTCFLVQDKKAEYTDVESKVKKLVQKQHVIASTSMQQACSEINDNIKSDYQSHRTNEHVEDNNVVKFNSKDPKPVIRGLPGEYVWTVKDKDGIIEKLYQYDHGIDFDNGDTIRRIREYSVYHDKDCMLDLANSCSTTIIHDRSTESAPKVELPTNRNFLTASPVFQKFLQNNQNFVTESFPAPAPPLLCG